MLGGKGRLAITAMKQGKFPHDFGNGSDLMKRPQSARAAAEDRLLGWFESLVEEPGDTGIIGFAKHIDLHLATNDEGRSWWPCFLARYTMGKQIDEERAARDFATFPPIARRVAELKAQKAAGR
jgi:hypothetical protein